MLSDNQIKKLGFKAIDDGAHRKMQNYYRFEADQTNLILVTDPCTAFYELWDGVINGQKHWSGPLKEPKSLIRKLITFGNNIPELN